MSEFSSCGCFYKHLGDCPDSSAYTEGGSTRMTDHPPTMTDAELLELGYKLEALRDSLPAIGGWTATAYLAEADYQALNAAKAVVDRLYRWTHWPTLAAESGSYLPAPALAAVPEPVQS